MAEIENLKIGNGTIHIVGNQDIVADSWEAGKTYVADRSYVIREHILYVCNTTHTSVEPFDPTKWTATTIGEALGMAGSANVIECTLAEYTAWKAGGLLINETTYILTDAPNLNATAQDLSYDGGATSTHDEIASKADSSSLATVATSGLLNDLLSSPFNFNGLISDLNITQRSGGEIKINTYNGGATNSPSGSAGGWVFTCTNNGSTAYGSQFALSNGGCYYRALVSNTYGTWRTIATA